MHKFVSVLSAIALAGGAVLAVSPPAEAAAIPGCKLTVYAPKKVAERKIQYGADVTCSNSGTNRGLYAELWHNYDNWPDHAVTAWFDLGKKRKYDAVAKTCDGGGSTEYYSRGYLTSIYDMTGVTKTSATVKVKKHC